MTDSQKSTTSASAQFDSFVQSAGELSSNMIKLSLSTITLPLTLLPEETRENLGATTRNLVHTVAKTHYDLANAAFKAVDKWASEQPAKPAARSEAPNR